MRKAITLGAALGLLGMTGAAAVADQSSVHGDSRRPVIVLVAEEADDVVVDLGETGFGVGDQLLISDLLLDDGRPVGRSAGTCQVVRVDGVSITVNCVTSLSLRAGQITVQGMLTVGGGSAGPFTAAVTGGTGAYRTVDGEMLIMPVDADTEEYRLLIER